MTEIRKGLAGVVVDTTAISKVNPETNSLLYRGYPVQELSAKCTFEEVALLLWNGELPTAEELQTFERFERAHRALDPSDVALIDALPKDAHPMDVVRTLVSAFGAADKLTPDNSEAANLQKAQKLFAKIPAVVAYDQRRRRGEDIVGPREDLKFSENFLWMTFGEEAAPEVVAAFEVSMILYAEHSFNASTFTARVITSTLADLHSAVTGAIGALKGPLHGGANEAVMHTFEEIGYGEGAAERAEKWLQDALAQKRKIMGFGHRVYKNGDSRVPTMQDAFLKMADYYDRQDIAELYHALNDSMQEAKGIQPNLDYPAGPAYYLMGFDIPTFTPLFVASRITGWTAHIIEQFNANALIRPLSEYDGPEERHL